MGHIDTAEASNVAILVSPSDLDKEIAIVLDDATEDETAPPAPEVAMALEDETAPPAPEVAIVVLDDLFAPDEETGGDLAANLAADGVTNQLADLAANLAADGEIELIESDVEVSDCVPGAAHVCGAPVPDAIIAAERAPLLEHAKQRKATKKKRSKEKGSTKKGSLTPDKKKSAATKRAAAKNTKKWLASMKAANAAKAPGPNHAEEWQERHQQRACKAAPRIRLSGKQPAPPAKKAKQPSRKPLGHGGQVLQQKQRKGREQLPEQVAVQAPQPPEQADPAPVGPGRVFKASRQIERKQELFQVRQGNNKRNPNHFPAGGGRQQAIQWIGVLKEVLEAGGSGHEANDIKHWLRQGMTTMWGDKRMHEVTGAEILGHLRELHNAD